MKIEMKPAARQRGPNDSPDVAMPTVWWWRVLEEEGGERINGGTGWQFKKEAAYGAAMIFLREERQRRSE